MIRINLLPVREKKKREAIEKQIFLGILGLIIIVLGCVYFYIDIKIDVNSMKIKNEKLKTEIENLKKIIGQVEEYEAMKAELEKKLSIITELKRKKTGPVHMLDEVAKSIPEKLWLKSLSEKNKEVKFSGVAVNNETIADFMEKLEETGYFKEVYLITTKQAEKEGLKFKEFEIIAKLTLPPIEKGVSPMEKEPL